MSDEKTRRQVNLQKYGTIAFNAKHIRNLIGMGELMFDERTSKVRIVRELNPTQLQLGLWVATIPKAYRPTAERAIHNVCESLINEMVDDAMIDRIAHELARECERLIDLDQQAKKRANIWFKKMMERMKNRVYTPEELNDLDGVVEQIHHFEEGGAPDGCSKSLLRQLIAYHGGKPPKG